MSENIVELNDENFREEISEGVSLVDFWAPWCGPCRMLSPIIVKLSDEYQGKAKIAKFNVEDGKGIPSELNVTSIPAIIVFKNGEEVGRLIGMKSQNDLSKMISAHLDSEEGEEELE